MVCSGRIADFEPLEETPSVGSMKVDMRNAKRVCEWTTQIMANDGCRPGKSYRWVRGREAAKPNILLRSN